MNTNSQTPHESRYAKVARMAHQLASQRLPRYSHPKSPRRFTQPQLIDPKRIKRAELVSAARLDGLFGQRWLVETVNSVIKCKFGDTIRSRSLRLQRREPLVNALVYNIHV